MFKNRGSLRRALFKLDARLLSKGVDFIISEAHRMEEFENGEIQFIVPTELINNFVHN
jgi:hypothetical protein